MFLEKELSDIKDWLKANNIVWAETSLHNGNSTGVTFSNNVNALESFKTVIQNVGIRLAFFDVSLLNSQTYNELERKVQYYDNYELNQLFNELTPYKEKYLGYELFFFDKGIIYKIERWLNALQTYSDLDSKLEAFENYGKEELEGLKTPSHNEVAEFGRILAEHENFEKTKNRQQRQLLAKSILPELTEYSDHTIFLVISQAEFHYSINVKPKKEKEILEKIEELKTRGLN